MAVVIDDQLADGLEFRSRLGDEDRLAFAVLDQPFIAFMGMTIDDGCHFLRMCSQGLAGPDRERPILAQVGDQDDGPGSFVPGLVDGLLDLFIEFLSCRIFGKAVNELPLIVLEVAGRRRNQGLRRRHADEGRLFPTVISHHLIRWEDRFPRPQINQVAAIIAAVQLRRQFQEARHAVVEFVIAGNGEIIAGDIHDVDNGLSPGQAAQGFALDGIASIDELHRIVRVLHQVLLILSYLGIAKLIFHTTVDVVGM